MTDLLVYQRTSLAITTCDDHDQYETGNSVATDWRLSERPKTCLAGRMKRIVYTLLSQIGQKYGPTGFDNHFPRGKIRVTHY